MIDGTSEGRSAAPPPGDAGPFPGRFLTLAVLATTLLLAWLAFTSWSWHAAAIDEQLRNRRIERLRADILLYDETLTMSARMAAATGEAHWEERYLEHEPRLAAALEEAITVTRDLSLEAPADATRAANEWLVERERRAFELVRQRRLDESRELLASDEYERHKREYGRGMARLASLLDVAVERSRASRIRRAFLDVVVSIGVALILAVAWFVVLRSIHRWREAFERGNERLRGRTDELVREVEERRRAERELFVSEQRFRAVVQDSPNAVVSFSTKGRIVYWNRGAVAVFGWSDDEALQREVTDLLLERHRHRMRAALRMLERPDGRERFARSIEIRARRSDGSAFPADVTLARWTSEGELLITVIVRDLSERKALERAALEAAQREQERLGRDLHDGLGQVLVGLGFRAGTLAKKLREAGSADASDADELVALIRRAITETRAMAHGLAPLEVDSQDLQDAFETLARDTRGIFEVDCHYSPAEEQVRLAPPAASHLYCIAREAVTNAVKHAEPGRVDIALRADDRWINLAIKDDGRGMPNGGDTTPPGLGLKLMRYRAERLEGSLEIHSEPGGGTTVACRCPADADWES